MKWKAPFANSSSTSNGIFAALAIFAFVVLAAAAVWMGGVNQDEGWYLYAANLVAEGQLPYLDFAYTQGPMMPIVYSVFAGIWKVSGLLGARIFTLFIGLAGILFFCATARRLAPEGRKGEATLVTFFLLAVNLYHLYFLAMPKTYALAALFVAMGIYALTFLRDGRAFCRVTAAVGAGLAFAAATGTRISLGAILAVVGLCLLWAGFRKKPSVPRWSFLWFGLGGGVALAIVYGGFLLCPEGRDGLLAAQKYHAARGGFDIVWAVGSFSRLIRWYLPIFIVLGLGLAKWIAAVSVRGHGISDEHRLSFACDSNFLTCLPLVAFLAVFVVQMLAPFPYEDYQVPIMGLLAVFAAVSFVTEPKGESLWGRGVSEELANTFVCHRLLVLGLAFATAFGSPLLEKWTTNGQDRFWTLKKNSTELAQLREAARRIREIDPNGTEIFTQDTYLAIETNRKVPKGLEMGPFSVLDDAAWRQLISHATAPIAAISGYTFAVEPPACNERSVSQQVEYFSLLKKNYKLVERMEAFGQNSTTLMILKHR